MSEDTLPKRSPMPRLPSLGELVHCDLTWVYRDGDGVTGQAVLRVWRPLSGVGHFAVVTETGVGRSVTTAAQAIRAAVAERWGEPLTLAEHWPAAQSPETGEHVDLVLPPGYPGGQGWAPLWPIGKTSPHAEVHSAWWMAYGAEITDIPR